MAATLRIDPSFARRKTAELMSRAQREIPLFHVQKRVDARALKAAAAGGGTSLTVALLPTVAAWLRRHPLLNAHWDGDVAVVRDQIDLGIAWAHRPNVLVVPTLRDCGGWSAEAFGVALSALRERSDADAFLPGDFAAPSFTVSNLGASGIDDFTSLVTPPQVGVLSLSAIADRPVAAGSQVSVVPTLPLTLGVDHRAIDGATAAAALVDLAHAIEEVAP